MPKPTDGPTPALYESQWWSRLAAISEMKESPEPPARTTNPERPGLAKMLGSLFSAAAGNNGLITSVVKTN